MYRSPPHFQFICWQKGPNKTTESLNAAVTACRGNTKDVKINSTKRTAEKQACAVLIYSHAHPSCKSDGVQGWVLGAGGTLIRKEELIGTK